MSWVWATAEDLGRNRAKLSLSFTARLFHILVQILRNDSIMGLYSGYSAMLLRNLSTGVLSYSSFEYLKSAVLKVTKQNHLEPFQSMSGKGVGKVAAVMYDGVLTTVKQILKEEETDVIFHQIDNDLSPFPRFAYHRTNPHKVGESTGGEKMTHFPPPSMSLNVA
ncbi:hypothetical protein Fmac_021898 [Flemingia macrophylla]|uniref:Uncharacterized protein n=1 Tax=Flemingia macrophylla TaxID=520843 RepID=A0ABD1LYC0_9FABA